MSKGLTSACAFRHLQHIRLCEIVPPRNSMKSARIVAIVAVAAASCLQTDAAELSLVPKNLHCTQPKLTQRRPLPHGRRGSLQRSAAVDLRAAAAPSQQHDLVASGGGWAAAGWVGGLALGSEVLQIFNTVVFVFILNRMTGAESFSDLVEAVASFASGLGWAAMPAFALTLHAITVLPLMSAILFIVLAGTLFGVLRGTMLVSLSLSSAAAISATISRHVAKARGFGMSDIDPRAAAVDAAIAKEPWNKALLLVTLLRLSPVLPFTFSNYLAGVTSIPIPTFFLGTFLGTLPTQAVYVGAGAIGRQALQGGVKLPKSIVALGVVATAAAIVYIGRVAQETISKMDLDSAAEPKKRGKA